MNDEAVDSTRKAGAIAREARMLGMGMVDKGVRLLDVAVEVESFIVRKGGKPAFPTNISINEIAAHYSPRSDDTLAFSTGDLVKVDVGAHVDGYIGDTAVTVEVGTRNWGPLIESSAKALTIATDIVREGTVINAIGGAIERSIRSTGYLPITNLTGHGMNRYNLHAGLTIPNFDDGSTTKIPKEMIIAIEPFATNGIGEVKNSKPGNIYRILKDREVKDPKAAEMFSAIKENFGPLPFCERWCTALEPDAQTHLKTLVRHGILFAYPILIEAKGGMVSQTEHTVLIRGQKAEITT
jgi:methionyl aminopeptidase